MPKIPEVLVAVDPGLREAGLAVFVGGKLARVERVAVDNGEDVQQWRAMGEALAEACPDDVQHIAVEEMRPRRNMPEAVPRIMHLVGVTGAFVGAFALNVTTELVDPHVWTAGLNKTLNKARIAQRLSPEETKVMDAALAKCVARNRKELWDAVGIGLFALKRL